MPSIENRIVQMEFDNTAFERRLSTTLQSLDKLNTTIANAGSKNGLANLADSTKNFNLSGMSASIEGISAKFLAMSTVAITVLSNIVNKAADAGARILKSLSLDPITSGFEEYSTQIGAIQTILANTASKGTGLEQVNAALDQLNQYSDKTIYNFTEMTRNIGTFTAAGVDLDTSVQSIKGIANLAAISGSNSQQASTAMYQLSQAIATGSVKLMDWNSVVNAGMGGEVFQKALFETGKMMGTISDVPMGQSFEEWTKAGHSFRESLQDGWITADVLTTTLQGFTGELTEAQLLSMGYTEAQAREIQRLGQLGVESATRVRTLRALIETTKEALSSGWAQSFRIIFGDFEEATNLFSGVSDALGGIIKRSADARNALLQGWADMGGRTALIEGLRTAFTNLGKILEPIKEAFHDIFPPVTVKTLLDLTNGFREFAASLRPSFETVDNIKRIFTGLFGVLEIGWTVIKEGIGFIGQLFKSLTGAGSGGFLSFAAKIGDFFTSLNAALVTGGGIENFFDNLAEAAEKPIEFIIALKDAIIDFFGSLGEPTLDVASGAVERLGTRFDTLKGILSRLGDVWEPLKDALGRVGEVLDRVWEVISNWFEELGQKLAKVWGPGDFDTVLDALNVGLLGGITALLAKFIKGGLNVDFGGGFFKGITDTFGELTGTLKAMQTDIKAEALLKIAAALGILTASVLVLSLIDSGALTASLTAMAVGFGQLVGTFALLNAMALGPTTAVKMGVLATALGILAGAMLIMSFAVRNLSSLNWEELLKGLLGVAGMLGAVTLAAGPLGAASGGLIRAGIGMMAVSVALNILAGAVKIFSTMDWVEMARGMVGVGVGLGLIAGAMQILPTGMAVKGAGILMVAAGLYILAQAVQAFAGLNFDQMARGMAGIGGGLLIVGLAMGLFPPSMVATGAGLLLVATSLNLIARAVGAFGGMTWDEIGKGLYTLSVALLALGVATTAMTGSIAGAVAIGVVSASLMLLVHVIKEMGSLRLSEILTGLVGLAAVLAILGAAAILLGPIAPALLALGAALLVVGAGFALFGLGAALTAKAFETLAKAGKEGIGVLVEVIDVVIEKIPLLAASFARGLLELAQVLVDAAPALMDGLAVILEHLLTTIIEIMPKVGEAIKAVMMEIIGIIREMVPEFIQLGMDLIISLLTAIRDNIGQIATIGTEIIVNLVNALAANVGQLVTAAVNLITAFLDGIAANIGRIVEAGTNILIALINGITNNISRVVEAVGTLVTTFITSVSNLYGRIITAGLDALIKFLSGITDNVSKIVTAVTTVITTFITTVGNNASRVVTAGVDTLVNFIKGVSDNVTKISTAVAGLITEFISSVEKNSNRVITAGVNAVISFIEGLGRNALKLANAAMNVIIDFVNGLAAAIDANAARLRSAGQNLAFAIIDGATFGLASKAKSLADKAVGVFKGAVGAVGGFLGIGSPSKLFHQYGVWMMEGLAIGLVDNTHPEEKAVAQVERMTSKVQDALNKFTMSLHGMTDMNPTITPVMDLSQVKRGAAELASLIPESMVTPQVSYSQAQTIASTRVPTEDPFATEQTGPTGDIRFEQNIYSPEQLSAAEIYRQTRNQLTVAKEELSIP